MTQPETGPAASIKRRPVRDVWWKVIRPFWQGIRWPLVAFLAGLSIVLGYLGLDSYFSSRGISRSVGDKLYAALQLFALEPGSVEPPVPLLLQTARFMAPAVTAYTALSVIASIFREQLARARVRWFASEHVLICGLGTIGSLLAQNYRPLYRRVVVIEKDQTSADIDRLRERGISVLVGDATDPSVLARANVAKAARLFAVTDDHAANAKIAIDARSLVARRQGSPLTCFVHLLDVDLVGLVQAELARRGGGALRLEVFNPSERGAPALLDAYPPFDQEGKTPFGPPHLLVVGLGQMGSRLVLHSARRWRAIVGPGGERFKVLVVDDKAEQHVEYLLLRNRGLEKACAVTAYETDVDTPEFEKGDFLTGPDGPHDVTGVYVCLGEDARGLSAGLRLRRCLGDPHIPIVVRTKQQVGVGALIATGAYGNLRVFGLLDLVCRPEVLELTMTETLARAIHEAYVFNQIRLRRTPETNPSMVGWDDLSEHLRESNRRQAQDIGRKLGAIGCDLEPSTDSDAELITFSRDEVDLMAEMEHDRWYEEKTAEGWNHGPERSKERKTSPHLAPWHELTDDVREYDRNTVRGMQAFLAEVGFSIVRVRRDEEGTWIS